MALCLHCGDMGLVMVGSSGPCPYCRVGVDDFEWHRRVVERMVQERKDAWVWQWLESKEFCGILSQAEADRLRQMYQVRGRQLSLF